MDKNQAGCGVVSYNESDTYHSKGCFKIKGTIEKEVLKYVEDIINNKNCETTYKCDEKL